MMTAAEIKTDIELITEFLTQVRDELIEDLDTHNRNATGRTKRSIKVVDVTHTGGKLIGAEHISFTFGGRGPGKLPPISNIIDWCSARGIPRDRAYRIAMKIKKEGTQLYRLGARNDNALLRATAPDKIEAFKKELEQYFLNQIKSDFDFLINR
ncbi:MULTISPECIES: hypothetical protein [Olivibacter]|uniref:Uncharacterized protein n=1 Tax=Olivibacter jilunii TaxID=985016 RepID=A0ABW6AWU5_9SPHI